MAETKLKRWNYTPKKYGLASQNEPVQDCYIECNVRLYPDMLEAYKKFAKLFNLDMDQFILSNGGENAMKQILLALKPKDLTWYSPTWKMPEVFCSALDIKPIIKEFKYSVENQEIYTPALSDKDKGDCFYSNYGNSSLFKYCGNKEPALLGWNSNYKNTIIDLTYLSYPEMHRAIHNLLRGNKDNIIFGSFDKLAGCGLRLGFAIFNKKYNDAMQLQREQYINSAAYTWLIGTPNAYLLTKYDKNPLRDALEKEKISLPNNWTLNNNYLTVYGYVEANLNEVHFEIDGHPFTKFGIPNTRDDVEKLMNVILDLLYTVNVGYK